MAHRAAIGKNFAGFIISRIAADEAEILSVAVSSSYRGRNIARTMLRHHLGRLAAFGVQTVFLEVDEGNVSALRLYRRAGFVEVGRRDGYYPGTHRGGRPAHWCCGVISPDGRAAGPALKMGRQAEMDVALKATNLKNPTSIEATLRRKGMRMTEQRRTIARVLNDADDRPDVEELYRRCAEIDETRISISTVYRTVKLFEDSGIIERHDFREDDGALRANFGRPS